MDTIITSLVGIITAPVLFLVSSGILLLVFGAAWGAFAVALVPYPARVDAAWHRLRGWPLIIQAAAWLLFLPVLAAVWVWRTSWPRVARVALVGGLAGWNLLMFLPQLA